MNHLTVETEDTFMSLLELAANNDVEGFKRFIDRNPSSIDEIGLWYGRRKGSKQMVNEHRTPLMVAATYGSIEVMRIILSLSDVDVNQSCGLDKSTALHCAASGGAVEAVEAVKLLLAAGADPNLSDANGHRPGDAIVVPPKLQHVRVMLEELLDNDVSVGEHGLRISTAKLNSNSPENGSPASAQGTSSPVSSPVKGSEKKEYPIDPSLPDIKNSIFSTDEFRMYSFKVRPCSRAYSHDWTECPFVHPGENARRRDPRKFHYSCVPCPDFRKGACRRGDMCEYAHGVFECWLHPAQYRTRLCKDGTGCARRVCFFAHTEQELRPLYVSTGSAVLSPRSAAVDFMNLVPGSPSSSPSPFTPPMSPSANGMSQVPWASQNVPTLHLPQSSRLRSSINARDIQDSDFEMLDFDLPPQQTQQILNELCLANSLNRSGRLKTNLTPSNLDELFSSESLSPRYNEHPNPAHVFSPTHKSAVINQFQQQQQTMLSPINTGRAGPMLHSSFGSGRMSPRNIDPISPMSARLSMLSQREQFRSLSSRELGSGSNMVGSPVGSWSKWGNSNGKPDWAVSSAELGMLRRSNSFNGEEHEPEPEPEPDLSWVQTLVKESPTDLKEKLLAGRPGPGTAEGPGPNISQSESVDHAVLGAWFEQMQLDQLVTQQN